MTDEKPLTQAEAVALEIAKAKATDTLPTLRDAELAAQAEKAAISD